MQMAENYVEMTADEISTLDGKKFGLGCLIPSLFILFIPGAFFLYMFVYAAIKGRTEEVVIGAVVTAIVGLLCWLLLRYKKRNNTEIDSDIRGRRKIVSITPIESKRVASTENKNMRSRNYGQVKMYYFMTVNGHEYKMDEQDYIKYPVGTLVEIHRVPHSKEVLKKEFVV